MLDESRERFRKSYAAGGDAYQRVRDDRRKYFAMVVVILLGSLLFESLGHYTTWSLVPRIVVSAAAIVFAQYHANRVFNPKPPNAG
jgi:hypothetical protein